ncbi:MAG: helix-turn-helix domain-containing protein [Methanosarcinales archaeon]
MPVNETDENIERIIQLHRKFEKGKEVSDDELRETIEKMNIKTSLTLDQLVESFKLFHKGYNDREIANKLGDSRASRNVERARVKMGLFRWNDFITPFDVNKFLKAIDKGKKDHEIAELLGAGLSTVRTYRQVFRCHQLYGEPDIVK